MQIKIEIYFTYTRPSRSYCICKNIKENTNAEIIANENDIKMFLKPWNLLLIKPKAVKPDILIKDYNK